jgi:hypothetical protein
MTEQLSVSSPKEVPKHKEALQEKYNQKPKDFPKDLGVKKELGLFLLDTPDLE